jgi:hypothetical protein
MTPDQRIALVSVIASGAVAVVALVATTWTAYLDRAARRKEAQTGRRQDRLERTYLELATYVHHKRLEAEAIRPFGTPPPAPEPASQAEIDRARSLTLTIASAEVRKIIDEFADALDTINKADADLSDMDHESQQTGRDVDPQEWGGTSTQHRQRLRDARQVIRDIDERRLHEQTHRELG